MSNHLHPINPLTFPDWDREVAKFPQAGFFHETAWTRTLVDSYGYAPCFLVREAKPGVSAVVPMIEINSRLTGRRGVCLPFTDFCEPLLAKEDSERELFKQVVAYGKQRKWKYLETRGWSESFGDTDKALRCCEHILDLRRGESGLLKALRSSTRRNIRKAENSGIAVAIENSRQATRAFYRLNCITRKSHGLPPQPWYFFRRVHENVIAANRGFIALARLSGRPVAAAVFFVSGSKAWYKYGASDNAGRSFRPNNLLIWESIRHCLNAGTQWLSLGKTLEENHGLMQFKDGWGGEKTLRHYQQFDIRNAAFTRYPSKVFGIHNRLFSLMPLPALRAVGSLAYGHIG